MAYKVLRCRKFIYSFSMPTDQFPVKILLLSMKLTNEPPKGIKPNMFRTFSGFDPAPISQLPPQGKKLLFSLVLFHALIQGEAIVHYLEINFLRKKKIRNTGMEYSICFFRIRFIYFYSATVLSSQRKGCSYSIQYSPIPHCRNQLWRKNYR